MRRAWRKAISVMFMTFIAVSILAATFITMYLYLTQHNLTATEAQRIYAEAAQERIDAFYYPPASKASALGFQRIMIYNRGIGTVIKYIFAFGVQETPLNSGDILLGSGESISIQLDTIIPDDNGEIRIVTERGSVFIAQVGCFDVRFDPERLVLYPNQMGISVLRIMSRNYESKLNVEVTESDIDSYELIGETEFYLARNGIHSITIRIAAPEDIGTYTLSVVVREPETEYGEEVTLTIDVQSPPSIGGIWLDASSGTDINNPVEIKRGETGYVEIYAYSIGGYSGSVSLETRSIERLQGNRWVPDPESLDITFDPNSVEVAPEQPGKSIMSIYVSQNAMKTFYRIRIAGVDEERDIELDLLHIYVNVVK
ncbi:MAG: hypothetical protein L2C94_002710 [Aigarchaeota archaeon]|nr:hypothetical protein [Candidatus Wolframiiraptor gerlachensis]